MQMKGIVDQFLYLMLAVIVGIILIVAVLSNLTPLSSAKAKSAGVAMTIGMNIDALSTVNEGNLRMSTAGKYDISTMSVGDDWYVKVMPAGGKDSDSYTEKLASYSKNKNNRKSITGSNSFCVDKNPAENIARLITCA